ncbi:MAG TPA: hypothetical protein VG028_01970 [Terriglobia bacterium]|nr:hypothetical protein [Terriglobia bacterium]
MARIQLWVDVEALKDALNHAPVGLEHDKAILFAAGVPPWFSLEPQNHTEQIPSRNGRKVTWDDEVLSVETKH